MPKHKSAEKRLKTSEKANARNRALRSKISTLVKKTETSPDEASLKEAFSLLDRASRTGAIHSNKASRIKSRLTKLVRQKTAPTTE